MKGYSYMQSLHYQPYYFPNVTYPPQTDGGKELQEKEKEASLNIQGLDMLSQLPDLVDLNAARIQTFKDIETSVQKGSIPILLNLMIKVSRFAAVLAWKLTVGTSLTLTLSAAAGLPVSRLIFSRIVMAPILGTWVVGGIACKLSAYLLERIRNRWIESSFRSAMQTHHEQIETLKEWTKVKESLPDLQKRLQEAQQNFQFAAQAQSNSEQWAVVTRLQEAIIKIKIFHSIENDLQLDSMPLLHRLINK